MVPTETAVIPNQHPVKASTTIIPEEVGYIPVYLTASLVHTLPPQMASAHNSMAAETGYPTMPTFVYLPSWNYRQDLTDKGVQKFTGALKIIHRGKPPFCKPSKTWDCPQRRS
ncbi:Hypothetical predicted protein [Podarcis lilfordi]|uniref:Uncharacterized protein n=1 Tax=Podarcis lilfordi TaxID=74358 RepID=A0AA35JN52_9SAUR|nr:Hypothetical predicted protein [Podarcis lilfordi]